MNGAIVSLLYAEVECMQYESALNMHVLVPKKSTSDMLHRESRKVLVTRIMNEAELGQEASNFQDLQQ